MAFNGLQDFITSLERENELVRIKTAVNTDQEITEIADRVFKSDGKALLFENTGTSYPLLINMFGSEKRMSLALGRSDLEDAGHELEKLFAMGKGSGKSSGSFLKMIPGVKNLLTLMPRRKKGRGACQQVVETGSGLSALPVLKCWPHDGGKFITLPVVHTVNPVSGEVNAGMYRMQVLDDSSTGMHWHRHKTGARHFSEYKKLGKKMPVAVTLGGDPVYTYCATAPLPEGIDEYMLAGFLRRKRVTLVKCLTSDLWVPADADFVIEGYVDPSEEPVWEGPFGDHTGFYSLADWYPRFHVTAITRRKDAVYPATIVGIPPQEDAIIGLATERLFLSPIKLAVQPDIVDFHMPTAGVAHNLVLVKIEKSYPGQGRKVLNALFGAGQMMFSKFIVVVDSDAVLTDYAGIARRVAKNCNINRDLLIQKGPLDILDHSSNTFSYGGKVGVDATLKYQEEIEDRKSPGERGKGLHMLFEKDNNTIAGISNTMNSFDLPVAILGVNKSAGWRERLMEKIPDGTGGVLIALDRSVDIDDLYTCSWQVLANCDPVRDFTFRDELLLIDATAKASGEDNFPRDWPNVVVSSRETIELVDHRWNEYGLGERIDSPSLKYIPLLFAGEEKVEK